MGEVFRARDMRLNGDAPVKVLPMVKQTSIIGQSAGLWMS